MPKFVVTVKVIRSTDIIVDAINARAARARIQEYGPDLATVDFDDVQDHAEKCYISRVAAQSLHKP